MAGEEVMQKWSERQKDKRLPLVDEQRRDLCRQELIELCAEGLNVGVAAGEREHEAWTAYDRAGLAVDPQSMMLNDVEQIARTQAAKFGLADQEWLVHGLYLHLVGIEPQERWHRRTVDITLAFPDGGTQVALIGVETHEDGFKEWDDLGKWVKKKLLGRADDPSTVQWEQKQDLTAVLLALKGQLPDEVVDALSAERDQHQRRSSGRGDARKATDDVAEKTMRDRVIETANICGITLPDSWMKWKRPRSQVRGEAVKPKAKR